MHIADCVICDGKGKCETWSDFEPQKTQISRLLPAADFMHLLLAMHPDVSYRRVANPLLREKLVQVLLQPRNQEMY